MKPAVVITRKDKRVHKLAHLIAFVITGGMSTPVTAVSAASAASYNRRTRRLAAEPRPAAARRGKVSFSPDEIAYLKAHTAR
jgi:hypothetical protein